MHMLFFYLAVVFQFAVLGGAVWALRRLMDVLAAKPNDHRAQCIDWLGNLFADILEHPRLRTVLAQTVANGMNHTMEQPDLGVRLHKVSESMREDNLQMSRTLGEQLPGLAKSFVGGAMSSIVRKKKPESTSKPLDKKITKFEVSSLSLDYDSSSASEWVATKKLK